MGFIAEIGARLSADNSDFKAKLDEAGQEVSKFDKQIKKAGLGFGGVFAIATAFRAVLDYVRDLEDPMDRNIQAAKRYAETLGEAKKYALSLGAEVLGYVNRMGEGLGIVYAMLVHGKEQVLISEKIAKQGEQAAIYARDHKVEQGKLVEYKKEQRELDLKIKEANEKGLDIIKQKVHHTGLLHDINQKLMNIMLDKNAREELVTKQKREQLILINLEAAAKKEDVEKTKASQTVFDKVFKAFEDNLEKRKKLTYELATAEEKIKLLEAEQAEIQRRIAEGKTAGIETIDLEVELAKLLLELAKKRKEVEAGIVPIIEKQVERKMELGRVGGVDANQGLSDQSLKAKIGNLRGQLTAIDESNFGQAGGVGGGHNKNPFTGFLMMELQNAEGEQSARADVARNVSVFGEDRAAQMASAQGNMPNFERLLGLINPDIAKQTANTLVSIERRLANSGLFPK